MTQQNLLHNNKSIINNKQSARWQHLPRTQSHHSFIVKHAKTSVSCWDFKCGSENLSEYCSRYVLLGQWLYYKNVMIVNGNSKNVRMMPQLGVSVKIIILMIPEPRFINYAPREHLQYRRHSLWASYFYSTTHKSKSNAPPLVCNLFIRSAWKRKLTGKNQSVVWAKFTTLR